MMQQAWTVEREDLAANDPLGPAPARPRPEALPASLPGATTGSVDVAVPSYGYGRYLAQCVRSVLQQQVPLRVLVLDDCSLDDTDVVGAALAAEDPRVTFVRHEQNRGHIATFNEGVAWATGDYMLLLSADDYLLPHALERAVAMLDAHPEMSLCVGQARVLLADGGTREVRVDLGQGPAGDRVLDGREFIQMLVDAGGANTVVAGTAVVRTRWLRELGGYREDMPHTGDLEMWMRLAAHGSVGIIDAPQAAYRRHAANMSDGYARNYGMADLRQRRDAFEVFGRHAADVMPGAERLHRRLLRALAREAAGQASAAYSDGALTTSRELMRLALETAPSVRFTTHYLRVLVKRLLGVERSRALLRWRDRRQQARPQHRPDGRVVP